MPASRRRRAGVLNPKAPAYVGIRGWLLLLAVGIIGGVLFLGLVLLGLVTAAFAAPDAPTQDVVLVELLLTSIRLVALVYTALRFFGKRRNAPRVLLGYMLLHLILILLELAYFKATGLDEAAEAALSSTVQPGLWFLVWGSYLSRSKRVAATFVR